MIVVRAMGVVRCETDASCRSQPSLLLVRKLLEVAWLYSMHTVCSACASSLFGGSRGNVLECYRVDVLYRVLQCTEARQRGFGQ